MLLATVLITAGCGVRRADLGEIVTELPEGPAAKAAATDARPAASSGDDSHTAQAVAGDDGAVPADNPPTDNPPADGPSK